MNLYRPENLTNHSDRNTLEATLAQIEEALEQDSMATFFILKLANRIKQADAIDENLIPAIIQLIAKLDRTKTATQELRAAVDPFLCIDDLIKYFQDPNRNQDSKVLNRIKDPKTLEKLAVFPGIDVITS
jgi:hypothetical protein